MPPSTLPPSKAADSCEPGSLLHIRRRAGSIDLSFIGSWGSDSNETMSNLPGPGRPLGQLLSSAGRRLEAVVDRTAARVGLGFEGIARRLLMKLRAPHSRCLAWPEFAKTPVVELAIELSGGRCAWCKQSYISGMSGTSSREIVELLLRLVPAIESDQPGNRTAGSMLLTAFALSDDNLLAALLGPQVLQRVELSLHSCRAFAIQSDTWLAPCRAVQDLQHVLTSIMPAWPSLAEPYTDQRVLHMWDDITSQVSVMRGMLEGISPEMSHLLYLRLERAIAAEQAFLQQIFRSPTRAHLDALYLHMLSTCSDGDPEHTRKLVATIVLLGEPTTPALLTTLLDLPTQEITMLVQALINARLLLIEDPLNSITDTTTIRICHDSLRDFVVDPERCRGKQYLVFPAEHHKELLYRCLCLLDQHLQPDICAVSGYGLANREIPDLSTRIARFIPEAVHYACLSWPVHLVGSGSISGIMSTALLDFCRNHLLHWLEVLSLLGELSAAAKHLSRLVAWCQSHVTDLSSIEDISLLLRDAYFALRVYIIPMTSHALQVYQSVLATGPDCKLLNHMRSGQIITPRLVSRRALDWSPGLQVFEGHTSGVYSVACSRDGAHIISGSDDKTIRVWDARTGEQFAVLQGHNSGVRSAAVSPDGAHIVSGSSDTTVRVWDAPTGKQLTVLKGHSSSVRSVSFSPDGVQIVSGSDDDTIQVWDVRTGKQLAVLDGHGGRIWSVAFSTDGARIVSGSNDETVRVWNARTGKQLLVLEGHGSSVQSVAFSPDGEHIVSGSCDMTARVWNARTGRQLVVLRGHCDWVQSVAFSPNCTCIVSGSSDSTVRVWEAQTGTQLTVLEGHSAWVWSVAFSPDGAHIVSGSSDTTVRVWDAPTGKQPSVSQGRNDSVRSVAISPDRAHVSLGSEDNTVGDTQTGKQLTVLDGHNDSVLSVAFSPDGLNMVSSSLDRTVRVWDVRTGKEVAVLEGQGTWFGSVDFSPDGNHIIYSDNSGRELVWNISDVRNPISAEPIADFPQTHTEAFMWSEETGWISWQRSEVGTLPLCWLPVDRRGGSFATHGFMAAIGAQQGAVTILDFSDVIAILQGLGKTPSGL